MCVCVCEPIKIVFRNSYPKNIGKNTTTFHIGTKTKTMAMAMALAMTEQLNRKQTLTDYDDGSEYNGFGSKKLHKIVFGKKK